MASITVLPGIRHLRSSPSSFILLYKRGKLKKSGRGLSTWFTPLATTLVEIPCDDRDETFLFHARSADFQDVTTQGVITWRIADPTTLASRIDFSIDPRRGNLVKDPLGQLSQLLIQAARQHAWSYLAGNTLQDLLHHGVEQVRNRIQSGLTTDGTLAGMGLDLVSVRVSQVSPTAELEKALRAPTEEAIQQAADEATFQRRALAVEKERAIQENELQNRIELARREDDLIEQQGANERHRATAQAEAQRIAFTAQAEQSRLESETRAEGITRVEGARVGAERDRMGIYRELPAHVLVGLAARELAGKFDRIEHFNITPDMLLQLLERFLPLGTNSLTRGQGAPEGG